MSDLYDVKISVRSSVKLLLEIKGLLSMKLNREKLFRDIIFGPWLDIRSHENDSHMMHYVFQHQVYVPKLRPDCPPIIFHIENKTRKGFKKINGFDLLNVLKDKQTLVNMLDEDVVRLCLLIASELVFMGKEKRNFLMKHIMWLVDDLDAWNAFPWGEYMWQKFYNMTVNVVSRHTEHHLAQLKKNSNFNATYNLYGFAWAFKIWILESYLNSKKWRSKKSNVIPRGLAWSKVTMFEKSDYEELFRPMSNPNVPLIASLEEMSHAWFKDSTEFIKGLDSQDDDGDGVLDLQTKDVIEEASMLPTISSNSPQAGNAAVSEFFAEFDALKKEVFYCNPKKSDGGVSIEEKPNFSSNHNDSSNHIGGVSSEAKASSSSAHLGNDEDVSHLADNMQIDGPNAKDLYSYSQHHLHLLIKDGILEQQANADKGKTTVIQETVEVTVEEQPSLGRGLGTLKFRKKNYEWALRPNYVLRSAKIRKKKMAMSLKSTPDISKQPRIQSINYILTHDPFVENLSRPDGLKSDKVTVLEYMSAFINNKDLPEYRFLWGKRDIVHLDVWIDLMWSLRPPEVDWAIISPHFSTCILNGMMQDYFSNGHTYPLPWIAVEKKALVQTNEEGIARETNSVSTHACMDWKKLDNDCLPREFIRFKRSSQVVVGRLIFWAGHERSTDETDYLFCGWSVLVDVASLTSFTLLFAIPTPNYVKLLDFTMDEISLPIVEAKVAGTLFGNTASSKTINSVKQIHAIVDGKAVVISESSTRSNLIFDDEDGITCLTNDEIFENLALMGYKQLSTKLSFQKGGSPRCQETMGGTPAQTRSKRVLEQPNEPPISEGHTSGSEEGRMEHTFELTDNVPPTLHDPPFTKGRTTDKTKLMFQDTDFDGLHDAMQDVERETVDAATTGVSTVSAPVTTAGVTISTAEPRTPPIETTVFDDEDVTMAMA
nr:hypothetical protein [Tanacetum cinerariifolium]